MRRNPKEKKLWKEVAEQATHLSWIGVTDVWLPPAYKSSAGSNGVGYDVYDLFDLGEFNQKGSVRTKYGTKKQLTNAIKILHRNNVGVMADIVLNHKNGADESETAPVIKVDVEDRNKVISEPFEKEISTKYYFPGRNKKYSGFVWDWHAFTGIDECTNENEKCIGMITLTTVEVTDDLRHARVYFSCVGDVAARERSLHGLRSASVDHAHQPTAAAWRRCLPRTLAGAVSPA